MKYKIVGVIHNYHKDFKLDRSKIDPRYLDFYDSLKIVYPGTFEAIVERFKNSNLLSNRCEELEQCLVFGRDKHYTLTELKLITWQKKSSKNAGNQMIMEEE